MSVAEVPTHILDEAGVKVKEGAGLTVTVACVTAVQVPTPPVTVYTVVPAEGDETTTLPKTVFNPLAGLQV